MKYWLLKISLIFINIFFSLFINYQVDRTFRIKEAFPTAVEVEKFWFLFLFGLMIFNFIYEKKILKHRKYKLAFILLLVDFLIILPIMYFTINELF